MAKDFRQGQSTAFVTNGCSNHSDKERQDKDYVPVKGLENDLLINKNGDLISLRTGKN